MEINNPNVNKVDVTGDHTYCRQVNKASNELDENILVNTNENDLDNAWQTVSQKNKRPSLFNLDTVNKKSRNGAGTSAASSPPQIQNRFDILSNDGMDDQTHEEPSREPKPPPVFVPDISNIKNMITSIESVISKDEYTYKCMNQNKVKINACSIVSYRKLVKKLTESNVSFYTFQIKQDRAYRVVLKNMHFSNDPQDIKSAIESYGHKVRNITNLKSYKTKQPTSVFFVDLEPTITNKDVFQIEFLLNSKIVFEPPRKSNDIVQCKKCQRYGHTKTYCWYPSRCVKCSLNHDTRECNKPLNNPPKCVLCNGDHPSNYKGCSVYSEIKAKSFPKLRLKAIDKSSKVSDTQPIPINNVCSSNEQNASQSTKGAQLPNNKSSTMSYAQVTAQKNTNNEENTLCQSLTLFFNKFEKLMEQQAQQIGSLINLLTTVISKLQ